MSLFLNANIKAYRHYRTLEGENGIDSAKESCVVLLRSAHVAVQNPRRKAAPDT